MGFKEGWQAAQYSPQHGILGTLPSSEAIHNLKKGVGFNTVSSIEPGLARSNVTYLEWMKQRFTRHVEKLPFTVPYEIVEINRFTKSGVTRRTLGIRIGEKGPGGALFCGHGDTVDTEKWNWKESNPFSVVEESMPNGDTRLKGRGILDMKLGDELLMATLLRVAEHSQDIKAPFAVIFDGDEELASSGADDAVEVARQLGLDPEVIIIPEPTAGKLVVGTKGGIRFSGTVEGDYAAESLIILGNHLRFQGFSLQKEFPDERFDPPHATINFGVLRDDKANNRFSLGVTIRNTPNVLLDNVRTLFNDVVDLTELDTMGLILYHQDYSGPKTSYALHVIGIDGHSAWPDNGISAVEGVLDIGLTIDKIRRKYPNVGIRINTMQGGTAFNIIPREAHLTVRKF